MTKYGDHPAFKETQALIAAIHGDDEELERLTNGMDRQERDRLIKACQYLVTDLEQKQRGSNRR